MTALKSNSAQGQGPQKNQATAPENKTEQQSPSPSPSTQIPLGGEGPKPGEAPNQTGEGPGLILKDIKNNINSQRASLNALIDCMRTRLVGSRYIALAITDAQRAFHHAGLALGSLPESENPYPESHDKDSKRIEPLYLVGESLFDADAEFKECDTQVARVKQLRLILKNVIESLQSTNNYFEATFPGHCEDFVSEMRLHTSWLVEVKMWLGWELGRIRDLQDGKQEYTNPVDIPLY